MNDRERAHKLLMALRRRLMDPDFVADVRVFGDLVEKNQNTPPGDGSFTERSWARARRLATSLESLLKEVG